jgi:isoleucyl-tRNA synthetase
LGIRHPRKKESKQGLTCSGSALTQGSSGLSYKNHDEKRKHSILSRNFVKETAGTGVVMFQESN